MDLDDLEEDVRNFASDIDSLCEDNYELNSLYKGVQIYYSPIQYDANIMFLGINPGAGYYNYWGEKVERFYELDKHEYIEFGGENDGYTLAQSWHSIFDNICRLDLLENSFKTNCYYFATEGMDELRRFKSILNNNGMWLDGKAENWTNVMLNQIDPCLLILEGFSVRNLLKRWYGSNFREYNRYRGYINSLDIEVLIVERNYSYLKNTNKIENALDRLIDKIGL